MPICKEDVDDWWAKADQETRQKAFLSVVKRIHQAEIQDRGSFKYGLIDVFNFGGDMYTPAIEHGYMELHNTIVRNIFEVEDTGGVKKIEIIDQDNGSIDKDIPDNYVAFISLQDNNQTLRVIVNPTDPV
jgi:hypothetical protein